jgi:hypothetical protein
LVLLSFEPRIATMVLDHSTRQLPQPFKVIMGRMVDITIAINPLIPPGPRHNPAPVMSDLRYGTKNAIARAVLRFAKPCKTIGS